MRNKESEILKCHIIDYLLSTQPDVIIANEVMYGSRRKVADLLIINDCQLIAIEVKSKSDNISRLSEQVAEYSKIFDKVYVFVTPEKENGVASLLPSRIGLFVITDNDIRMVKRPLLLYHQDKSEMLASMNSHYLRGEFGISSNLDSDIVRKQISAKSKKVIHDILVKYYRNRFDCKFKAFINDKGEYCNVDDLPTLSSSDTIVAD